MLKSSKTYSGKLNSVALLLFCGLMLLSLQLQGQKVGLVLSGGGAKGVAHIGVIRALEEEGIPIDFITGTSMGAIIGSLYAIGWTTEEMERVILSDEFQHWSTGNLSDDYKYYFKQSKPTPAWVNFSIKVDSTIQPRIPVNIVSPFQMDFVFLELYAAASAASGNNFDRLWRPFRCVAADIESNKPVILQNGELGNAVRASMTFPFYFKPIRIDGTLLFDGGMYNNFPVDVMFRDFFPDIIIGSKTSANFKNVRDDDILSQLEAMLTVNTDFTIPCENGVLIEPKLPNVNVIDFSNTLAIIDSGYVATKKLIPEIRAFVYDTITRAQVDSMRKSYRSKLPAVVIDSIHTRGLNEKQSFYFNNILKQGRELIDISELKKSYFTLLAENKIKYIFPRLKFNEQNGLFDLFLDMEPNRDLMVEFGGNISSSAINSAFIGLRYNMLGQTITTLTLNSNIGRFYSSATLDARIELPSAVPFYLEPNFTYHRWDFFNTNTYFFEDKTPSYLIQTEAKTEFNIGLPFGTKRKIVLGVNTARLNDEYYQTNTFTRNDTVDLTKFWSSSPYLIYEKSTLNAKQFARRGGFVQAALRYISGTERHYPGTTSKQTEQARDVHSWWQMRLRYLQYMHMNPKWTLGVNLELLFSNQDLFSNYTSTMLVSPGYQPFPGASTKFIPHLRAHSFLGAGIAHVFTIRKNLDARLEGYMFLPYRQISEDNDFRAYYERPFKKAYVFGTAALVFHTPLGPISLNYDTYGNADPTKSGLMLNFGYLIYNRRAFQ